MCATRYCSRIRTSVLRVEIWQLLMQVDRRSCAASWANWCSDVRCGTPIARPHSTLYNHVPAHSTDYCQMCQLCRCCVNVASFRLQRLPLRWQKALPKSWTGGQWAQLADCSVCVQVLVHIQRSRECSHSVYSDDDC